VIRVPAAAYTIACYVLSFITLKFVHMQLSTKMCSKATKLSSDCLMD
jgi:hypothetical protein